MPKVVFKALVGQARAAATLARAIESGHVGQAYLFCGDEGVGTFTAAREFACALLCGDARTVPCMTCESCRTLMRHANPDFHLVMPVCLDKEHRKSDGTLSDEGWQHLDRQCRKKITDPYAITAPDGIADIPVEWIREVNHAIQRGSVQRQRNVAVICDIDLMNRTSANAMLKTLEEPPANTVIILTSARPWAVLPTIVSRCQILRFGSIGDRDMAAALSKRSGLPEDDERILNTIRCAEGSLGTALNLLEQPVEQFMAQARELLSLACGSSRLEAAIGLERFIDTALDSGRNADAAQRLLLYVMYGIRDSFLRACGATEKYIRKECVCDIAAGGTAGAGKAAALAQECQRTIAALKARGNVQLVLAAWLISMMEMMHGEKQASC